MQATDKELLRGHSAAHIAAVDSSFRRAEAGEGAVAQALPQDIFVSDGTPAAARLSSGCVIEVLYTSEKGSAQKPRGHVRTRKSSRML